MESGVLFKKGYLIPMLRCVGPLQANYVIREIHMGSCGMHVGPRAVVRKAMRQGYYWPTMHADAKTEVDKCDSCQIHSPIPRLPKTFMTSIMAPWPFYQCGMDIIGPLTPARGGAKFVIVAIDYFTKWVEAKPLVKITGNEMNTAVAHPQANGLVERANRSLMKGIKTRLGKEKAGWVDELPNVLWAHRTSIKQSNGETPFSLTYGSEAVIPAEIGMSSYRTLMIREEFNEEEQRLNLDLLQERREAAAIREARYKTKMEHTTIRRYAQRDSGQESLCVEGMRRAEWWIKESWVPSGKAHTGSQKRLRMALTILKRLTFPDSRRDDRNGQNSQGKDFQKGDYRNSYKARDNFNSGRHRDYRAPYPQREQANRTVLVLSLDSLTKCPKEILATETQLQLPPPRHVANPLRTGDPDKYCDYHQDKGHHTNDCIQLRKQLEIALESGNLNHLMKDMRQRVERRQNKNPPTPKVINMVDVHSSKKKKRKDRETTESWMNTPISFPPIMTDDASDEPLIIEAEIEGYLVRRVYVDEGSSVEVMFEHCFENLPKKVKAGLKETRTDLVGFAGEVAKPLGKIDLEVCFGNEGLSRRTSMKYIVIRAPSPYNVILGRPGLKTLHVILSTIHSMIKFPTPKGIATLIGRTTTIAECRLRKEKRTVREETPQEEEGVDATEQIIVNPSFPDQMVTIGGRLSKDCKDQLKTLLKGSMEVFAWEPADMTGVPRKIIEHALNVNPSLDPVCQKRRTFSPEKAR
ncbi:reverse transcriptase domain-containing protein [Tanacetum coccineum]|uniref:Reverse transcriptase domain-containing protein n=1 Tax=Tanacetum coccineum TaxID=301880 RepID=A0ABQ5IVT5_9ASTR